MIFFMCYRQYSNTNSKSCRTHALCMEAKGGVFFATCWKFEAYNQHTMIHVLTAGNCSIKGLSNIGGLISEGVFNLVLSKKGAKSKFLNFPNQSENRRIGPLFHKFFEDGPNWKFFPRLRYLYLTILITWKKKYYISLTLDKKCHSGS